MKSHAEAQYICKADETRSAAFETGMKENISTTFFTPAALPEAQRGPANHDLKTTATIRRVRFKTSGERWARDHSVYNHRYGHSVRDAKRSECRRQRGQGGGPVWESGSPCICSRHQGHRDKLGRDKTFRQAWIRWLKTNVAPKGSTCKRAHTLVCPTIQEVFAFPVCILHWTCQLQMM